MTDLSDPHIFGGDPPHSGPTLVVQNLVRRKPGINLHAQLLGLPLQPPAQLPQTDDVVPLVLQLLRQQRSGNLVGGLRGEKHEPVVGDGGGVGGLGGVEFGGPVEGGEEFGDGAWVEDVAGEDVGSYFAVFVSVEIGVGRT